MQLIDTHSHIYLEEFKTDLPEVVSRAKAAGVIKLFLPNIDTSTIGSLLDVTSQYPDYCFPMIGLHPTSVNDTFESELSQMECLLKDNKSMIAIGEVGMDLYWDTTFKREQEIALDKQIQWSLEYKLPLVIHSRNSFNELYTVLKNYSKEPVSGIFHSFTGSLEEAEHLLEFENFKLGINGVVTFKKSELPEVLKQIPIGKIVLETDSPYLTPVPHRGKRNESSYIRFTLEKLSEIYQISAEEAAGITTKNALKVFKMED